MRHRVKGRKLGRTTPHRKATLRALSSALIKEHRIETTLPKAKELRTFIEPLITTAKVDNTHNRRKAFSSLQDKQAVTELFNTVGPAAVDRPGGYTRVLKLGFRLGDAAEMAVIELVDFNDVAPEGKSAGKKRTRRAGKSNKPVTETEEKKSKKEKTETPEENSVADTDDTLENSVVDTEAEEPSDHVEKEEKKEKKDSVKNNSDKEE